VITLPQGFELSFELTMETLNQQAIKLERSYLIQRDICNFDDKPTCRYDKTHVELLLAVSKPEKHLGLLSLLHWFGLQVRVVSSAQAMKKHWQTGRYLVLLNAFELSPFIELAVGSAISRGVFNFSGIENGILSESQQRLSKNWLLGNLPKKLDLTSLEQLLKPWLKEKKILVHKNTEVDVSQKSVVVLDGNNASAYEPQDSKPAPAFDMFQYTENQGGPESAVYMLDEYLESNQESLTKLRQAIASENDIFAQQALDQLVKNAQILAAQKTIMLCTLLNDALYKKDFALMLKLLDDFTEQLLLVDAYAKTI
jgi:HPt (histidine-containing phosphotransfer) domain-containing protein